MAGLVNAAISRVLSSVARASVTSVGVGVQRTTKAEHTMRQAERIRRPGNFGVMDLWRA